MKSVRVAGQLGVGSTPHEFSLAGGERGKRRVQELGIAEGVREANGDRLGGEGCGAGREGCG